MLEHRHDAYRLLASLGASPRLLNHLALVGEAADLLADGYRALGLSFDERLLELGVAVHDAGKIRFPQELDAPGHAHEAAGQAMLLEQGVEAEIARCCISHAAWQGDDVTFEERSVALADKLWKGKREPELELLVIDMASLQLGRGRWDVFEQFDTLFECIAAGGPERLQRSRAE